MGKCPICNKKCRSKIGFYSHIYWKHLKRATMILTVIIFILGILATLVITTNTENINYLWDKYALKSEPRMYVSINSIAILKNNESIENLSQEKKMEFLNEFVKIGIIPPWHKNRRPLQNNLRDPLIEDIWCMLWGFDNAEILVKERDLPPNLRNSNLQLRELTYRAPSADTLNYLESECPDCLAYEIYGLSKGNRDIDIINFEICFPDENFIIQVSSDIIRTNDHCIRIKKENIIEKEDFLGTVYVKNNNEPLYWDVWWNPLRKVDGKYVSKGKSFSINENSITRIISGLVSNCSMPEK